MFQQNVDVDDRLDLRCQIAALEAVTRLLATLALQNLPEGLRSDLLNALMSDCEVRVVTARPEKSAQAPLLVEAHLTRIVAEIECWVRRRAEDAAHPGPAA